MTEGTDTGVLAILFGLLVVILIIFLLAIIVYIFQAIGLFKIAKREGKNDIAWLAWIPIVNSFLLTLLVEKSIHEEIRGKLTLIFGIAFAVGIVIGSFFTFVLFIPQIIILYAFYFLAKRYSPNPILHLVIAIVTIGISVAFQIFFLRNKKVYDATGLDEETIISEQ